MWDMQIAVGYPLVLEMLMRIAVIAACGVYVWRQR